ncbi:hypothetical protein [Streptomyces avidinii]|uniref:MYXO-CTERM domain-containing protein n=1 Tax=Streptomyces avidinii TaxID=1895 RepID=A0ABS4L1Y3_STRAV|nr:hypothetical protein [Streptomyces avidinii]MBP2035900.1 hypothetical protein [Streptomyces avidinii]GGY98815.1 hypothetical protein GCM10010343_25510 [Streptomyces avidinii]
MPRSDDTRTTGPGTRPGYGDPVRSRSRSRSRNRRRARAPGEPRPHRRAYRRAGAWLAVALGIWAAVAGATLPNGLVLAAGLVVAALAVNRLGAADPRAGRRAKPMAPP